MKTLKFLFVSLLFIQSFAVISFAQNRNSAVNIQVSGIQSGETFEFKDAGSNRVFTFRDNRTVLWDRFPIGISYRLTQTSGSRPCKSTNNQGTVPNTDITISFDCAGQYSNVSIQVLGIGSGESFVFRKNASNDSFNRNETRGWKSFLVGSNYSFSQIGGPRQCRITNNPGTVPAGDLTIVADCSLQYSNLSIRVFGIEAGESFVFRKNSASESYNRNETRGWSSFLVGTNYSFTQSGGPRQCKLTDNVGRVPAADLTIVADCSKPQTTASTPIKITVSGVRAGESFTFKDRANASFTFTASQTKNVGSFPVGTNYNYTQTAGARQCRLTNNQGIVPANEVTVTADCTPPITENPPTTGTFGTFDLVSRSSDQHSFGTFYGSVTPVIGGINRRGGIEGQFVAYATSWNVDPKHGGKYRQIIWFDRANGKTSVVSRNSEGMGGDKDSSNPSISDDGYTVAFESVAANLVGGDTNKVSDIFVWNMQTETVKCITCSGNYGSFTPSISGDGKYLTFASLANNLTEGVEGNSMLNVYLADLRTGEITLISKDPKNGKGISGSNPSISADGSRIAFYSYSDKLVENDTNKLWDIFVWERGNPKLKRISLTAEGTERNQGNDSISRITKPTISGNGNYVAFSTTSTNMGGSSAAKAQQVYVVEINSGRIVRASSNAESTAADGDSPIEQGEKIALSYDGKWVAFTSKAANLGGRIILKNIETGEIIPFQTEGGVGTPTLSHNGKCIAFPADKKLDKRFDSTGIFAVCR